jgi:hypothetical protein
MDMATDMDIDFSRIGALDRNEAKVWNYEYMKIVITRNYEI